MPVQFRKSGRVPNAAALTSNAPRHLDCMHVSCELGKHCLNAHAASLFAVLDFSTMHDKQVQQAHALSHAKHIKSCRCI